MTTTSRFALWRTAPWGAALLLLAFAAHAHEGGSGGEGGGEGGHGAGLGGQGEGRSTGLRGSADVQQRRAEIRAALTGAQPMPAASAAAPVRRLSDQERADLREQLRREMQLAQPVSSGS